MTYIALGAVLIAAGAWITVPFAAIPFTMQTFSLFAVTLLLGGKRACVSVLVYIALGAAGVPVFSGFRGGVGALAGATGGYIAGFIAVPLVFWLFTKLFGEKLFVKLASLALGLAVCYLFGTAWYALVFSGDAAKAGFGYAFSVCVLPYIPADAAKLALAAAICVKVEKYFKLK
ncbi:MAG: biotin transporter BioY [Clostridia bacterium]|nr:biotin transporter BioY [Clostridia bacterium]